LHKAYSMVDFGHAKISDIIFSGRSLLLSTTVLNDAHTYVYDVICCKQQSKVNILKCVSVSDYCCHILIIAVIYGLGYLIIKLNHLGVR